MHLPGILKATIQRGHTPLVLGADLASEAEDEHGRHPPRPSELAILLADHFLDGEYRDSHLSRVAEYAISEHDLFTVQEFVRSTYSKFRPSQTHKLLKKIRWHGLASTTFDRYIEDAYLDSENSNKIVPFIDNSDRVREKLRDPTAIPLLKLHGCVSRTNSVDYPLILTPEQSIQFRDARSHLFNMFIDWARELSVVFVGYDLDDQHIRQVLLDLDKEIPSRPRYYLVSSNPSAIATRLWEKRNIQILKGTPKEFLETATEEASGLFQGFTPLNDTDQPIKSRFVSARSSLSHEALRFLDVEAEYVNAINPASTGSPKDFYHGRSQGWTAIQNGWDLDGALQTTLSLNMF